MVGLQTNQCCCGSESSSISSSVSEEFCPSNDFDLEIDITDATDDEIQDLVDSVPDPVPGWDLRASYVEIGPGRVPIVVFLHWECCDGKPTGPGGPSEGSDPCDDIAMDELTGEWLAGQGLENAATAFRIGLSCDEYENSIVDADEPGFIRTVFSNKGCLNCCGDEVFDEIVL